MKIFYSIATGRIRNVVPKNQSLQSFYTYHDDDFIKSMRCLEVSSIPSRWYEYIVVDNKLVKMEDEDIHDIDIYGRVLTSDERLLNQLKPSHEEIAKAKNTIEILTLLQEVM